MLLNSKPVLKSTTIWGGLLAFSPLLDAILTSFGMPAGIIPEGIAVATGAVGGVMAIIGRLKANSKLKIM